MYRYLRTTTTASHIGVIRWIIFSKSQRVHDVRIHSIPNWITDCLIINYRFLFFNYFFSFNRFYWINFFNYLKRYIFFLSFSSRGQWPLLENCHANPNFYSVRRPHITIACYYIRITRADVCQKPRCLIINTSKNSCANSRSGPPSVIGAAA